MVKHIVVWDLKVEAGGKTAIENASAMKSQLEALVGIVPGLITLEVNCHQVDGPAQTSIALYSEFNSWGDLDVYQTHPDHEAIKPFVRSVTADRKLVDYEV